jgi:hypothetical protein
MRPLGTKLWDRRGASSLLATTVSLLTHGAVIAILSWIVISNSGSGVHGISLTGTQLDGDKELEVPSLEIAAAASTKTELDPQQEVITARTRDVSPSVKVELVSAQSSASQAMESDVFAETSVALMMGGFGEDAEGGGGGSSERSPNGYGASFFGARASGNRFVYVIDSSTSMIGPRWEALRVELSRAIRSLSPDQEFFVIGFDVSAHPMFNLLPPKGKFLNPTSENVSRLNRWVASIKHGDSTRPATAIGIALRLEPDAIFLLSDGEIRDNTLYDLRTYNRKQDEDGNSKVLIPIHTVLLHSEFGYLTLKTIADENDGVFTPVSLFRSAQ